MIPRSMWRQRADSSSTRDKEKESKRWGHLERLKKETDQHLCLVPARRAKETSREECRLHSDIPRSEFQTSSRSKLWKVNKINYLQNQICVLKLYSVWFLLCHICHVYLSFVICLFLV
ncbi:hypothetical protein EV2_030907 [Malus domestica]